MAAAKLKGRADAYLWASVGCNRQLLNAFASVMSCGELLLSAKHVIWDRYEMLRKYFGWEETYG